MNQTDCERCGEWFEYEGFVEPVYCDNCQTYLDYLDNVEYIDLKKIQSGNWEE